MKRPRISWPLALVVVFAFAFAFLWLAFDRLARVPADSVSAIARESQNGATKVKDALNDLFHLQPIVTTRNEVKIDPQTSTVARLALASRETEVSEETSATWLGSTKRVRLRARYRVQAGFDLAHGFSVVVVGKQARVEVPRAEILTVEPLETHVDELEDGFWNRVQPGDVQLGLENLAGLARARTADLPDAAEAAFTKMLSERLSSEGVTADIQFDEARPAAQGR
ncbi:MAG TPA: DUF4230 domain-containing protein [Chthoniobacterales bacterium]